MPFKHLKTTPRGPKLHQQVYRDSHYPYPSKKKQQGKYATLHISPGHFQHLQKGKFDQGNFGHQVLYSYSYMRKKYFAKVNPFKYVMRPFWLYRLLLRSVSTLCHNVPSFQFSKVLFYQFFVDFSHPLTTCSLGCYLLSRFPEI